MLHELRCLNLIGTVKFYCFFKGFGSLLRSFRIYRSTDQDMCRDLSGRRMRDIKEEEKLKSWISKKAEREAEKERKRYTTSAASQEGGGGNFKLVMIQSSHRFGFAAASSPNLSESSLVGWAPVLRLR